MGSYWSIAEFFPSFTSALPTQAHLLLQYLDVLVKDDKNGKGKQSSPFSRPGILCYKVATFQFYQLLLFLIFFFSHSCRDMKFTYAIVFLSALIFNPGMNAEGRVIQKEVNSYTFYFVSLDLNMRTFAG